ncbi:MAG: hypothetical protein RBR67_17805 [Desulfobacterium sp.]|nr:hypothetical protein [Desulfobacterium sp.]
MLWQKVNPVTQSYNLALEKSNYERKEKSKKLLDFYHDQQLAYVYDRLRKHFSDPDKFSLASLNIVRKIIDGLACVYLEDAKRIVTKDQPKFDQIQNKAKLGIKLKTANRLSKLLGTVLLKVVLRNGKIELDILTPDICDVTTGDSPEDLKSVTITYFPESGIRNELEYTEWTADTITYYDYNKRIKSIADNPYQTLPFVPVWDSLPISDFWVEKGDSLVSVQEAINEKITDLMYILRLQGFSVPVTKGSTAEIGILDPGQALNLPEGADFKFEAPGSPIKSHLDTIEFLIRNTAISYGLPASYLSSKPSERKSGLSRLIENKELAEKRQDDIALFRSYEGQVFDIIREINNYHNIDKISMDAEFKVDFAEPKNVNLAEQATSWTMLIDKNAMSAIDVIEKMNPDLTREQAQELYFFNIKINSSVQDVKQEN